MPVTQRKSKTPVKTPAQTVESKTPAKAKETDTRQQIDKSVVYESTGSYNPKAEANISSYAAVCKVLPAKYEDIVKAIPQHTDFIGYLIRRGGIAAKKS